MSAAENRGAPDHLPWWRRLKAIRSERVPQPYRNLLDHRCAMTPTLARWHGGEIALTVLRRAQVGDLYSREILLTLGPGGPPVERACLVTHLEQFSPTLRADLLGETAPFGALLHGHGIDFRCNVEGLFSVQADSELASSFGGDPGLRHFARRNLLETPGGRVLARVVEVLPLTTSTRGRL